MSSIRNSVPSRSYRERAQPLSRERRHGLLEKRKDYSLRARDHNEKKARLRLLRQKAADRNPDEFYFSMVNGSTRDGVKVADRGNKAMGQEVVKLLKTQDAGYLRTLLQMTRRERAKLEQAVFMEARNSGGDGEGLTRRAKEDEEQVVVAVAAASTSASAKDGKKGQGASGRMKTIFVEEADDEERAGTVEDLEAAAEEDEVGNSLDISRRAKTAKQLEKEVEAAKAERSMRKRRLLVRQKLQNKITALEERERQLALAEQELEKQRAQMSNATGGVNKDGVKFKVRERKR